MSCFQTCHQLLPGSKAVSVYLTCLPSSRKVDSSDRVATNGVKHGGQNCNDGKDDVFLRASVAMLAQELSQSK